MRSLAARRNMLARPARHVILRYTCRPAGVKFALLPPERVASLAAMRRLSLGATVVVVVIAAIPSTTTATTPGVRCVRPDGVQRLVVSAAKYPNIRRHFRRAVIRRGWPRRLVLNRRGADGRRDLAVARCSDTRRLRP
jgi:hypothetical protein